MSNIYYESSQLWGREDLTLVQKQVLIIADDLCRSLEIGTKVADFGCGDGIVLDELIKRNPHCIGYGIDASTEALKHMPKNLYAYNADLVNLPFDDDYFDIGFCIDVLEHIQPSQLSKVINELIRVCKGKLLIVTPYLESDAIKTKCPYCNCIFSPYYHLNQFSISRWVDLFKNYDNNVNYKFIPVGLPKAALPSGLGEILFSSGNYAIHSHDTICPQCKIKFSRPQQDSSNISVILNSYASKERKSFGRVSEEIGILLCKYKSNTSNGELNESNDSFQLEWKLDNEVKMHKDKSPFILVESIYNITFSNSDCIRNGMDMFYSPSYVLNNKSISADDGILKWMIDSKCEENKVTIVFPPIKNKKEIGLEIKYRSRVSGILKATLIALPPYNSIEIGKTEVCGKEESEIFSIILKNDDFYITPYGLIVEIMFEPKDFLDIDMIELISINDITKTKEEISLAKNEDNKISMIYDSTVQYSICHTELIESMSYIMCGYLFDITSQIKCYKNKFVPLAVDIYTEKMINSENNKRQIDYASVKITELNSKIYSINLNNEELKNQIYKLAVEKQDLDKTTKQYEDKLAILAFDNEKLKDQIDKLTILASDNEELKNQIDKLTVEKQNLDKTIKQYEDKLIMLASDNEELKTQIGKLAIEKQNSDKTIKQYEDKLSTLTLDLEVLKEANEYLSNYIKSKNNGVFKRIFKINNKGR